MKKIVAWRGQERLSGEITDYCGSDLQTEKKLPGWLTHFSHLTGRFGVQALSGSPTFLFSPHT